MPLSRLFAVLGILLFAWPAASPTVPAKSRNIGSASAAAQIPGPSVATAAVAKVRTQWAQFLNAKQIGALMSLYAPNAVFLQPTGQRINGAPSIRAMTQKIWSTLTPDIAMHGITTRISCDMAYDEGEFQETLTSVSSGAKQHTQGQYLMIFKRDIHGRWLIVEQVWTGAEPKRD
jgi:ketosteroid isomerase-like protein